jgi:CubicO group peptidase (beta-lactamase class C family)
MADFNWPSLPGYGYGLGVRTLIDSACSKSPLGEFGWDGAAGAYALIDPINHISIFYAHEILGMMTAYSEIHPTIRDLVYEAVKDD